MSVMLFNPNRYARIYQTLRDDEEYGERFGRGRFARLLGYPEGWQDIKVMEQHIKDFCELLHLSNVLTFNRQYSEDAQKENIMWAGGQRYNNKFELLKSLQGVHYNLIDNGGSETNLLKAYELLNKLIYVLQSEIIDELPQYEKADTWGDD